MRRIIPLCWPVEQIFDGISGMSGTEGPADKNRHCFFFFLGLGSGAEIRNQTCAFSFSSFSGWCCCCRRCRWHRRHLRRSVRPTWSCYNGRRRRHRHRRRHLVPPDLVCDPKRETNIQLYREIMIDLHLYQHPPWNLLKNPTSGEYVPYFSISLSQFIQSSYNIMECEVGQRGEREREMTFGIEWKRLSLHISIFIV